MTFGTDEQDRDENKAKKIIKHFLIVRIYHRQACPPGNL